MTREPSQKSMRVLTENPPNVGVALESLNGDLLSQGEMYVRCNFAVPSSPPDGFEVVVPGMRRRSVSLTELEGFERVERDIVLECAGNGRTLMRSVPDGTPWDLDGVSPITVGGYRLSDVLGELPENIVDVVFTGADTGTVEPEGDISYQFSINRDLANSPLPLLVTHIGGEPLDLVHGAPIRLIVAGHYAMKSVKWLVRVEATTVPFEGHFVTKYRYYHDDREPERAPVAELAVRSLITAPSDGDSVPAGSLVVSGSAWSGSQVSKVEVSFDGGESWQDADLDGRGEGPWAAVHWHLARVFEPGRLEIIARATDISGDTQPLEPRWNVNGYANNVAHRVGVDVTERQ